MGEVEAAFFVENGMLSGYARALDTSFTIEIVGISRCSEKPCGVYRQGTCTLDARVLSMDVISKKSDRRGRYPVLFSKELPVP